MHGIDPDGPAGAPLRPAHARLLSGMPCAEKGGDIESKEVIEKMKKLCKAHRNILDMEPGFIDKQ